MYLKFMMFFALVRTIHSRTIYPALRRNQTNHVIPNYQDVLNFHSIIQKPESITESGWKPIFYPHTKNIVPTSPRRITYNVDSISDQRYHRIQQKYKTATEKNIIDVKARLPAVKTIEISKAPAVPLSAVLNASSKPSAVERVVKENNVTKTIDHINLIIIEKLQKTLEDFAIKFNKMLERAVKESTNKIDIHHAGQSSGERFAEAGYRGPPPITNLTWTNNGTLHYHQEEEDTEPNQRDVARKQETANEASTSRINAKNKRRIQVADLNVYDWNKNDSKATDDVKSSRVVKSIYPNRVPSVSFNHSFNSDEHKPPDPYVALFLSHYGKYLPLTHGIGSGYRNLYSYIASNNIHNNKPFGSYKIYEDSDG